jgi:hypothetical protein
MNSKIQGIYFLIVMFFLPAIALAAKPVATIDRANINSGESFILTIRAPGQSLFSGPELSPLDRDFEVLGSSKNSRSSISNGRSESYTEWRISLMPKSEGALVIPPIKLDGESTDALIIKVSKGQTGAGSDAQPIFLEAKTDQDEVFVQSQLIFTVRIYHAVSLGRNASLTEPESNDAFIKKISENNYEQIIKGVRYGVFERNYAVFPQGSGTLTIPALQFTANLPTQRNGGFYDPFNARSKTVRVTSDPVSIKVRARPDQYSGDNWLPANTVAIIDSWSSSPLQLHVGESVTRTVAITADGLLSAQLPEIKAPALGSIKFYPDQPALEDSESPTGVTGKRIETYAIVPTETGEFTLPAINISWWDVKANRQRTANIPAKTLKVLPAFGDAATNTTAGLPSPDITAPITSRPVPGLAVDGADNNAGYWPWIAFLLFCGWIFSTIQWLRLRQPRHQNTTDSPDTGSTQHQTARQAFKALEQACNANDPTNARNALIAWGRINWSDNSISSLSSIKQRIDDEPVINLLDELEKTLFGPASSQPEWQGKNLLAAFKDLAQKKGPKASQQQSALPPLYKPG